MPVLQYVRRRIARQLPCFLDAAGIDERRMQRIANEMAFPETRT